MSYLLDALQALGIYHTPPALTSSGKTRTFEVIMSNPPFSAEVYDPYLPGGVPYSYLTYNNGASAYAVRALLRYLADPVLNREPSYLELRPVIEYCEYYLAAPMWVTPKRDLLMLRAAIEHVRTAAELERWLYECSGLGIEPL